MPDHAHQRRHRRYDPLAVLAYIADEQRRQPRRVLSQRRIQVAFQISAPSVVHAILHRLEQRGLLTIANDGHGLPSELTITTAGHEAIQRWRERAAEAERPVEDGA